MKEHLDLGEYSIVNCDVSRVGNGFDGRDELNCNLKS
jgi:hypothetical protein